jgi:hypothetical protein
MKICGKNRQLLIAANRYLPFLTINLKKSAKQFGTY